VDIFLQLPCFFDDPADVGNLSSGSSAFSKTSLNIWKFTVHVVLKPGLENSERDGNTRPPDLPPEKSVCRSRNQPLELDMENRRVPNRKRSTSRPYIVTLLI